MGESLKKWLLRGALAPKRERSASRAVTGFFSIHEKGFAIFFDQVALDKRCVCVSGLDRFRGGTLQVRFFRRGSCFPRESFSDATAVAFTCVTYRVHL